ncbi:MAG: hypothetical protein LUH45_05450 [Clostridiales bacterium]|nr:hypothetical protein [Clostridiales bacterium]
MKEYLVSYWEKPVYSGDPAEHFTDFLNSYAREGWTVCRIQADEKLENNLIVLEREIPKNGTSTSDGDTSK